MITAVDAMTAWAMFNKNTLTGGGIWKTTDGGTTWNQQGAGTIFDANSFPDVIYFWNANDGVAIGDPNPATAFEIYTTNDGGANWTLRTAPAPLANEFGIVNHYAVYGNSIWFDTDNGRVYHSADKGMTWTVSNMLP